MNLGGWRVFKENLNYSEEALNLLFPKHFKDAGWDAKDYARKPKKIANAIYENRMGNGNEASGDGWKYRGRGPIQITGKNNYNSFIKDMDLDIKLEELATNKEISIKSAIWYWNKNNLNKYADNDDIEAQTRAINGGDNGLKERLKYYNEIKELLNE